MEIKPIKKLQGGGMPAFVSYLNVPTPAPAAPYSQPQQISETQNQGVGLLDNNMLKALYETGLLSDTEQLLSKIDMFISSENNPFDKGSTIVKYKMLIHELAKLREGKRQLEDAVKVAINNDALEEMAITTDNKYYVLDENGKVSIKQTLSENDRVLTNNELADLRANSLPNANNISTVIANGTSMSAISKQILDIVSKLGEDSKSREFFKTKKGQAVKEGIDLLLQEGVDGIYKIKQESKDQYKKAETALQYIYNMLPKNAIALLRGKAALAGQDPNKGAIELVSQLVLSGLDTTDNVTVSYEKQASEAASGASASKAPTTDVTAFMLYQTGQGGSPFKLQINPGQQYAIEVPAIQYNQLMDSESKTVKDSSLQNIIQNTGLGAITETANGIYVGNQKIDKYDYDKIYTSTNQFSRAWLPAVQEPDGSVRPDLTLVEEYSNLMKKVKDLGSHATTAQIESLIAQTPLIQYYDRIEDGVIIWDSTKFKPFFMLNVLASGEDGLFGKKGVIDPETIGNWATRAKANGLDEDILKQRMIATLNLEPEGDIYEAVAFIPISDSTIQSMVVSGQLPTLSYGNPVALHDLRSLQAQEAQLRKEREFKSSSSTKLQ